MICQKCRDAIDRGDLDHHNDQPPGVITEPAWVKTPEQRARRFNLIRYRRGRGKSY
jgi:hypothetical protein